MPMNVPECAWSLGAELGEGPIWMASEAALWFVDIKGRRIHRLEEGSGARRSWASPEPVGALTMTMRRPGSTARGPGRGRKGDASPGARIAESPVSLECRLAQIVSVGENRIVLGEVVFLHIREEFVDTERLRVRTEGLNLIGRMHGGGWYARTSDLFDMPRISYAEWQHRTTEEE